MVTIGKARMGAILVMFGLLGLASGQALAEVRINGQAQAGGGPLASSTVTLWAASSGEPKQLAQTMTGNDGHFVLNTPEALGADVSLYVVAKGGQAKGSGDNPAITLLTVLGNTPPPNAVINEMTTIASVWTHNQFIDGAAIKGSPLALRIAAGNVPNFVDLTTGGYGTAISDALNSAQTPTMANFVTC